MDWPSVLLGGFVAIALQFGLLAIALYPIMRREFLLWVALRVAMIAVMIATLSPLAPAHWFADETARRTIGGMANAASVAVVGPFLASYVERHVRMWPVRKLLRSTLWIGIACALAVAAIPVFPWADTIHDTGMLVLIALVVYGLAAAIQGGSRAAKFQAVAWTPGILVGLGLLSYEFSTGAAWMFWNEAIFAALSFEFVVTTMGVADGFMVVKRERDVALAEVHAANRANATDPLTGIANRRGLMRHYEDGARGTPAGIAIIDCDNFKAINDRFGHDMGDDVLIAVARAIQGEDIFAARLGGEEFIVLVYARDWQAGAEAARRRITHVVRTLVPELPLPVSASAGLSEVGLHETLQAAMKRADRALYAAKEAGRNRSVTLGEYHPAPEIACVA